MYGRLLMRIFFLLLKIVFLSACFLPNASGIYSQVQQGYKNQFRIYADDDYLNIRGSGTDKGYTGGLQLSYLFTGTHPYFLLNRILPRASAGAVNTYGINLGYVVFTPSDLSATAPIENDYPYSGAIMLDYGLQSFNPAKKYNFQSKITIGGMGPVSCARQFQVGLHKLIGAEIPQGWNNQLKNDILISLQFGAEKGIIQLGFFDGVAGGKINVGTLINNAEVYGNIRLGKITPYFNNLIAQNGSDGSAVSHYSRWQAYFFAKTGASAVASNALLEGGMILGKSNVYTADISHLNTYFNYGLTLVFHNFSVSLTQKAFSSLVKGLKSQETGNLSLFFSW